jgi:hypothetical protein
MKPIDFAPDARAEFEAAVNWYEAKAAGLGERFVHHVDEALRLMAEAPVGCPKWEADPRFRRVVVQRFPYLLFIARSAIGLKLSQLRTGHASPAIGFSGSSVCPTSRVSGENLA